MTNSRFLWPVGAALLALITMLPGLAQQPPEPVDRTPINGEVYVLVNQSNGLQLASNSVTPSEGGSAALLARDFTSLSQRWALTRLDEDHWRIGNVASSLCLAAAGDEDRSRGDQRDSQQIAIVKHCSGDRAQQWMLTEMANGYYTLRSATGVTLAASGPTSSVVGSTSVPQQQLWLLRPAYLRGADIAEQEKMEAIRLSTGLPWWKDAEQPRDILRILKDHGFNSIRLRPTSIPPYYPNQAPGTCSGNSCYIETDAQELDLARRARNLGMSLELTLFFDGGSSQSVPGSWAGASQPELATDVYNYVKAELEAYRKNGLMPDMVSIGNEVDTGFIGGPGYYPYNHFEAFAALEKAGMQAVADAASDTSIGAPLPAPLTCIHITPGYNMTSFFQSANQYGIPYDAICQSYYPIYHGPLTQAQADATNPQNKPVEASVLLAAAQTLHKPIYILETGEHYEEGFDYLDPWYAATQAAQRQFLLDLEGVVHSLPNNLGMGVEYWAPNDVQMPDGGGPYSTFQKDYTSPNAIFAWEGLSLFDSADPNYLTNSAAPNYSTALPGLDAVGGKLDATLTYKLVNRADSSLLRGNHGRVGIAPSDDRGDDRGEFDGLVRPPSQWQIASTNNGFFTIANVNASSSQGRFVLTSGPPSSDTTQPTPVVLAGIDGSPLQGWDVQTAGEGFFFLVNQSDGRALAIGANGEAVKRPLDGSLGEQWKITPTMPTPTPTENGR
ncbi:MAG: hypothetical protein HIU93_16270 [Acidobacteria bacterium]|nr:hypothetical protein [Acidobacteriota bacterium]